MTDKPKGWEETLDDLIRAKFSYEDANSALKKKYGDAGTLGGLTYREHKDKLFGGDNVDEKLDNLGAQKQAKKPKPKSAWDKKMQTAADNSKLAQIINMGIYQGMLPFCANHELKEEHVHEINPGGAIIANITYYFPESKLEHPLIMLGIRVIILYIKFKSVCGKIAQVGKPQGTAHEGKPQGAAQGTGGLKPGVKTEMRR